MPLQVGNAMYQINTINILCFLSTVEPTENTVKPTNEGESDLKNVPGKYKFCIEHPTSLGLEIRRYESQFRFSLSFVHVYPLYKLLSYCYLLNWTT